jgi:hypothetical protein
VKGLRAYAEGCAYVDSREQQFELTQKTRRDLHQSIIKIVEADPHRAEIARMLGLDIEAPNATVDVYALRVAHKVRPNRTTQAVAIVELTQTRDLPLDETAPSRGAFAFHSGSTLVIDLKEERLQYAVVKNAQAPQRLQRTREYLKRAGAPRMALYAQQEPFAFLHASEDDPELGRSLPVGS